MCQCCLAFSVWDPESQTSGEELSTVAEHTVSLIYPLADFLALKELFQFTSLNKMMCSKV